jgi:myo-inositol-1(or 4)-monophosphatase
MPWNRDEIAELLLEGAAIARRVKQEMSFELKPDLSIVTPADREIEILLSKRLEDPARGLYLIGEETVAEKGEDYLQAAFRAEAFVVDPIDGTAPFAHMLPNWGISVGRMVNGSLTDGAVYLPETGMGELVISDGGAVLQGTRSGRSWDWKELPPRRDAFNDQGLVAITQNLAKWGKVHLRNPVMVLGAAVVPMVGLVQGRFLAYIGSVKLWDIAGSLPLILRHGFAVSVMEGQDRREVSARVEERTYHLEPHHPKRWALRSDLVICRPEEELRFRSSFRHGTGEFFDDKEP